MTDIDKKCCDENHEEHCCDNEEYEVITLTLEDDSELECIVIGAFDFEDDSYIALLPNTGEEDEDVLIYSFKELDDEEIELKAIEDEDLFNKVAKEFEDIFLDEEE